MKLRGETVFPCGRYIRISRLVLAKMTPKKKQQLIKWLTEHVKQDLKRGLYLDEGSSDVRAEVGRHIEAIEGTWQVIDKTDSHKLPHFGFRDDQHVFYTLGVKVYGR